jgi:ferritin-like metal-binding protein YciE
MAKEPKKLDDLFHDRLKDIYFTEKKILTALPKMAKAVHSDELRVAFEKHHGETEGQVERLEKVFDMIGKKPQGKTCDAIIGLVEEGQEVMKQYKGSPALDARLLAGAQAVEHYEISRYGTLKTWANELGLGDAIGLFDATLQEDKEHRRDLDEDCGKRRQPRRRVGKRDVCRIQVKAGRRMALRQIAEFVGREHPAPFFRLNDNLGTHL